jgi:hypothetical protein
MSKVIYFRGSNPLIPSMIGCTRASQHALLHTSSSTIEIHITIRLPIITNLTLVNYRLEIPVGAVCTAGVGASTGAIVWMRQEKRVYVSEFGFQSYGQDKQRDSYIARWQDLPAQGPKGGMRDSSWYCIRRIDKFQSNRIKEYRKLQDRSYCTIRMLGCDKTAWFHKKRNRFGLRSLLYSLIM